MCFHLCITGLYLVKMYYLAIVDIGLSMSVKIHVCFIPHAFYLELKHLLTTQILKNIEN